MGDRGKGDKAKKKDKSKKGDKGETKSQRVYQRFNNTDTQF